MTPPIALVLLALALPAAAQDLAHIRLPEGFRIELFAKAEGARHLAVDPAGRAVFAGTRRGTVWKIAGGAAVPFAPGTGFRNPNGVCFDTAGNLYVAEQNRVRRFANAGGDATPQPVDVVPQGGLVPAAEDTPNHGARTCRIGADGKLYVTLGQPYNVPPRDKLALYAQWGIGGIVRFDARDGGQREVFATGIRNSVGLDFNPADGTLWFTDNQTDGMGDDIPPGEINRATKPGQFFGYPWTNGRTRITQHGYDRDPLPPGIVEPQATLDAHAADLGLVFYGGTQFPPKYRGGLFSAQHGSWNRSTPIGARVMFTPIKADGTAGRPEVFAEGWLDAKTGRYLGRPVDVAVLKDGSLLVSDDHAGAVWRISYGR